jgi:hypothetical protein
MTLKEAILLHINALQNQKLTELKQAIDAAQASANTEDKSSAGDKYETGRAMAQNTRDMYAKQYAIALADKALLQKIQTIKPAASVVQGSLVHTSVALYLIGLGLGKIELETQTVLCVSASTRWQHCYWVKRLAMK